MRLSGSVALAAVVGVVLAGCAVRLGGPSPERYVAVATRAGGEDAAATAARLQSLGARLVLLSADRDSAWFADVAQRTNLKLSGPGRTGPSGLAFLTPMEAVGDTSLVLEVPGGGQIHMHDALYEIDKDRHIDLMLIRFDGESSASAAVTRWIEYYATDVGNASAVLLALETTTPAAADSVTLALRSALASVADCGDRGEQGAAATGTLRLFYGPQARIACERGEIAAVEPPTLVARVVVGR